MKTVSINVSNLCVPCENRCRYCLLSWGGKLRGVEYDRSAAYARRFYEWLKENRPELGFGFYFGYSMEHPKLLENIDFLREIGSPGGEFLQLDGMKFRNDREILELLTGLQYHGIGLINLTFYGTEKYHDRFAARQGDFDYLLRILKTANKIGLDVSAGIALNHENSHQSGDLLAILQSYNLSRVFAFVPHGEGRGKNLESIRFRQSDYDAMPDSVKAVFNRSKFRPEMEWIRENNFTDPQKRVITLNLTPDNMDTFEALGFDDTIAYLERLDDTYYSAVPSLPILINRYGDLRGECYYSERDLFLKYQRRYISEECLNLHDVNDECTHFSRRF